MRMTIAAFTCGMLVLGLAVAAPALAQDAETPPVAVSWETWEEAVDGFFARLAAGEPAEAVSQLYAGYPWMDSLGDQVRQLETRFAGLSDTVGGYVGRERLAVQPLSERFVYVWYVAFYERQPLQFHFSFYKPGERWVVHQFAYDEGVTEVAREMARRRLAEAGGGAQP